LPPSKLVESDFIEQVRGLGALLGSPNFHEKFALCDPTWSPKYAVNKFLFPETCSTKVLPRSLISEVAWRVSRDLELSGGIEIVDLFDAIKSFDSKHSSPGPGFSPFFKSRYDIAPHVCNFTDTTPFHMMVKEEVSKIEKIEQGNYRIIFNANSSLVLGMKQYTLSMNHGFTKIGLMLKGGDPRYNLTRLATGFFVAKEFEYCIQGDAHSFDTTITHGLLLQVYRLRNLILAHFSLQLIPQHLIDQICKFTFSWYDLDTKTFHSKLQSVIGNPSGQPNTTEDESLLVYMIIVDYAKTVLGLSYEDFFLHSKFEGCGDDYDFQSNFYCDPHLVDVHFSTFGINMESWSVKSTFDFDILGAHINSDYRPYWSLEKMLVHLQYCEKDKTLDDFLMRACQCYAYLVYHPQGEKFREFFVTILNELSGELENVMIYYDMLMCSPTHYFQPQNILLGTHANWV